MVTHTITKDLMFQCAIVRSIVRNMFLVIIGDVDMCEDGLNGKEFLVIIK